MFKTGFGSEILFYGSGSATPPLPPLRRGAAAAGVEYQTYYCHILAVILYNIQIFTSFDLDLLNILRIYKKKKDKIISCILIRTYQLLIMSMKSCHSILTHCIKMDFFDIQYVLSSLLLSCPQDTFSIGRQLCFLPCPETVSFQ